MNIDWTDFHDRCFKSFESKSDGVELIKEFRALDGMQRVSAWTFLMKDGASKIDFARYVHRLFCWAIIEAFQLDPTLTSRLEEKQQKGP